MYVYIHNGMYIVTYTCVTPSSALACLKKVKNNASLANANVSVVRMKRPFTLKPQPILLLPQALC